MREIQLKNKFEVFKLSSIGALVVRIYNTCSAAKTSVSQIVSENSSGKNNGIIYSRSTLLKQKSTALTELVHLLYTVQSKKN